MANINEIIEEIDKKEKDTFTILKQMLATETDPDIRQSILEELSTKTDATGEKYITEELRQEINKYIDEIAAEYQRALDDYQALIEKQEKLQQRFDDLGGQKKNANQEEYKKLKAELEQLYVDIADAVQRIEDVSTKGNEPQENKTDEYSESLEEVNRKLKENRQALKQALARRQQYLDPMLEIYNNTRQRFDEGDWVKNEKGEYEADAFDKFVLNYIEQMEQYRDNFDKEDAAVKNIQATIRELEKEQRKLKRLQQAEAEKTIRIEKARELNISLEEYTRIVETVSKKSVYREVLEKKGLGEIIHKRGGRSKQERQAVEEAKEEIITRLVEEQRKSTTQINIKETIDILYGTELSVKKAREPRKTSVSSQELDNISKNTSTGAKKLQIDPTYKPNYKPGQAPTDVPRLAAAPTVFALPAPQKVLALPPARTLTAKDYQMTQEAFEDYIAEGFVPGTEEFDTAVIYDGTGVIPRKYIAPEPEKKVEPVKKKEFTAKDYQMTQEAFDDYIAEGFVPGTEEFDTAVIYDGTGKIPRKEIAPEPQKVKGGTFTTPDGGMISIDVAHTPKTAQPTNVQVNQPKPKQPIKGGTFTTPDGGIISIDVAHTPKAVTPVTTKTPTGQTVVKKPTPKPGPTQTSTPKPTPTNTQTPVTATPKATPTAIATPTPKKQRTNLYRVIQKITKGADAKAKDGGAYRASNIKVAQNFRNELKSGNYLYNIVHLAPAIIKVPIQFFMKLSGKIRFGKQAKKRVETMKRNIENLTEDEIMILFHQYKGNRVIQENLPSIINILIEEKIQNFILGKVTKINQQLETDYNYIFSTLQQIEATDNQLRNNKLTAAEKNKLLTSRKQLVAGAAQVVSRIRENYDEAQELLSGGLQGFSQDMKAATTKLSVVGMRFAKKHDLDHELLEKQAKLKDAENKAIDDGNDEMALRVFVESEKLLSEQTSIENSIFGRRSTGKKYYSPLAEKLDYRDDPFIRDLFTTAALASAAFNVVNTIKGNNLSDVQAEIDAANKQLGEAQQLVDTIKGHQGTMKEGMEAQAIQGTTSITGQVERGALDSTNWGLGSGAYRTADNAGHAFYNQVYSDTQAQIGNITSQYASNAITQAQALEMMRDLANGTQSTLNNVSSQCLQVFTDYAKTHPSFDLTAVTEAVQYITQHPDAISNMNNAIVDISNMAEGLTITQIQALQTVPADMLTPLIGAASVAALTTNISQTMDANVKKGKYGNAVTQMVDEYAQEHPSNQQSNQRSI